MRNPVNCDLRMDRVDFRWQEADIPLFNGVNLVFPSGKTTCLIGPNGSGKTTLLELLLGWRKAVSGEVLLGDRSVADVPGRERGRMMALVPQDERLPFSSTVIDYILLGRAPHLPPLGIPGASDRRLAFEVLDRIGIASLAHRIVPRLSGGERRMVMIARALVQDPRILLLDEPTNHLDPANRERIISVLRTLRRSGITMVLSSHEPDLVARLADRVILLRQGEFPLTGPPSEMLAEDHLTALYEVPVRILESGGRRVVVWGPD